MSHPTSTSPAVPIPQLAQPPPSTAVSDGTASDTLGSSESSSARPMPSGLATIPIPSQLPSSSPPAYPPPSHTNAEVAPRTFRERLRTLNPFSSSSPSSSSTSPPDLERGVSATNAPRPPPAAQPAPPRYEDLNARFEDFINPGPNNRPRRVPSSGAARGGRPATGRPRRSPGSVGSSPTVVERSRSARRSWVPPPPAFGMKQTPDTVSKIFFFYGFIFPIFWILGALVLTIKLQPIPEQEGGKSPEEQADMLGLLREAEVKWAYRCLWALTIFLIIVAGVVIGVVCSR